MTARRLREGAEFAPSLGRTALTAPSAPSAP
jgi:hypothetical protein